MKPEELQELSEKTKEPQVFILSSKISFPLNFAEHVFFVIKKDDKYDRYEVLSRNNLSSFNSYYYKNYFSPFQTLTLNPITKKRHKNLKLIKHIIGTDTKEIVNILEKEKYPNKLNYNKYLGPNSNTYAQWIINQVPGLNIKLPWNAYGKSFRLK